MTGSDRRPEEADAREPSVFGRLLGVIDESAGYFVGIGVVTPAGDRLTIFLALEYEPAFTRTVKEKADELRAGMTAPRS